MGFQLATREARRCPIDDPAVDESVRTEAMAALGSAYVILDRHDEPDSSSPRAKRLAGPVARQALTYLHAAIACLREPECARRLLTRSEGDRSTAVVQVGRLSAGMEPYLWRDVGDGGAGRALEQRPLGCAVGRRGSAR